MRKIWLSIIVPIYNPPRESFENCLNNLLGNLYEDVEVLLIDDGSEVWVQKLILNKVGELKNVKYLKKENGGVSSARNFGITYSSGEYLCFADADDELFVDEIYKMRYEIPSQSPMIVFDFIREQINNKMRTRISLDDESKIINLLDKENSYHCINKMRESVAKLYKKDFLLNNNLKFDDKMAQAEDMLFLYEIMSYCTEFYYCHNVVYKYYWDIETTNKRIISNPVIRLDDARKAYLKQCEFFGDNQKMINLCTDNFINTLGSRTLLLMYNNKFSNEVKNQIKNLINISVGKSKVRINKRSKVYQFLFLNNLWIIFSILSEFKYKKR